jgi:hypothetical protein
MRDAQFLFERLQRKGLSHSERITPNGRDQIAGKLPENARFLAKADTFQIHKTSPEQRLLDTSRATKFALLLLLSLGVGWTEPGAADPWKDESGHGRWRGGYNDWGHGHRGKGYWRDDDRGYRGRGYYRYYGDPGYRGRGYYRDYGDRGYRRWRDDRHRTVQ